MRLLRTGIVLGVLAATAAIDCGGKSNAEGSASNNTAPDGSLMDAATSDADTDAAQSGGGAGPIANGGANSQGGQDAGGTDPNQDACPDTATDAFGLLGDTCSGSDVCVYPGTHIAGECDGTFVSACVSGTWSSQCFISDASTPPLECTDLDGPDAGTQALRECSENLLKPVLWGPGDIAGVPNCGPIPQPTGCQLPWGCMSFDDARARLAQCTGTSLVHDEHSASGWGLLILEDQFGQIVRRGYYDETTGALVGTWVREGLEEYCAGTIPTQSFDNGAITDRVELCLADGGPIGDAG